MSTIIGKLLERVEYIPKAEVFGAYEDIISAVGTQEALTLWEFYRNITQHLKGLHNTFKHGKLRKLFLDEAMEHYDGLALLVLQWESLPVSVTKTLLWRENIDFQSFESFLRRLTLPQKKAIETAYYELFEVGKIPTCMLVGRGKWLNRHMTIDSLLEELAGEKVRYLGKSAWVKNYAGLDFGFELYPNGANNDTKARDSGRKFLALQNKANDFVVNQHDGIYWYLFRTLRSNYLWNRYGEVKLKSHICPGFRLTMIMWVLLVLVSPVLVTLATIKFGAIWLGSKSWVLSKSTNFVGESVRKWILRHIDNEENMAVIGMFVATIFVSAMVLLGALIVAGESNSSYWFATAPTVLCTLIILKTFANGSGWTLRKDPPPFGWLLTAVTILWIPIEHYKATIRLATFAFDGLVSGVTWLGAAILSVLGWLVEYSLYIIGFAVLLYVGVFVVKYTKEVYARLLDYERPEYMQRWHRGGNIFGWALLILGFVMAPLVLYMPGRGTVNKGGIPTSLQTVEVSSMIVSVSVVVASLVLLRWLSKREPKKVRLEREFRREVAETVSNGESKKLRFHLQFLNNVWLLKQPDRMKKIALLWEIYCEGSIHTRTYVKADRLTFKVLPGYVDCEEWLSHFVLSFLRGETYASSLKRFNEVEAVKAKTQLSKVNRGEKISTFFDYLSKKIDNFFVQIKIRILKPVWSVVTWPFVKAWSVVRVASLVIKKGAVELYDLWKEFNELCPHVADEKDLR